MKDCRSKKYRANQEKREVIKKYTYREAIEKLIEMAPAKYDETVDVAFRLGVDPKQSDQQVRGAVVLPNGTGKKIKVLVFAKGEKEKEARDSGADYVGSSDLIEKIEKGWMDFDKIIATPDMMGTISKLGKVLGPRGLMPNPKLGTVTFDVGDAVKNERKGKVEYRIDKSGIVHSMLGKVSFGKEKLQQNFKALADALLKQKPAGAKGVYIRSVTLSSTHGPGIKIDPQGLSVGAEEA